MKLAAVPASQFNALSLLSLDKDRIYSLTVALVYHRIEFHYCFELFTINVFDSRDSASHDIKEALLLDEKLSHADERPFLQLLYVVELIIRLNKHYTLRKIKLGRSYLIPTI